MFQGKIGFVATFGNFSGKAVCNSSSLKDKLQNLTSQLQTIFLVIIVTNFRQRWRTNQTFGLLLVSRSLQPHF